MEEGTIGVNPKEKQINGNQYRSFKQIVNTFYNEEVEAIESDEKLLLKNRGTIRIEPKVMYDKFTGNMKVEFKIGTKRMYKVKELSEFYNRMLDKTVYKYGDKLQFMHVPEMFEEESRPLLDFILKYAEIIKYANSNSNSNYRYYGKALSDSSIILGNTGIDDLFDVLNGKVITFQKDYSVCEIEFTETQPRIEFKLKKIDDERYAIVPNVEVFNVSIIKGKNYKYILDDKKIYRCTKDTENTSIKLLEIFRQNYMTEVYLGKEELKQLFSVIIPKVKNAINIENIPDEEIERYKPKELETRVYLDFDEHNFLIAELEFIYGEDKFNPLNQNVKIDFPRNIIKETKLLNIFRKTGFMLDAKNQRFILPHNDQIYKFLSEEIEYYMQTFEVMATEKFKAKQIIQPKIGSIGIKVENDLLSIDLKNMNIDARELQEVMSKYSLKQKYYRLKSGEFITLQGNKQIEFLSKLTTGMDINYKELSDGEVQLPISRSLYLNRLLKEIKGVEIVRNSEYKEMIHKLDKEQIEEDLQVPQNLENVLRYYQKIGFKWLKTLDNYKFGGILADDMGLGKTVQMLSIIVDYVENSYQDRNTIQGQEYIADKVNKRASLVVSPSSLTLNWQNETKKFAPNLKTIVIKGTLEERKRQIEEIDDYDLVITSYDLLKRDIDLYVEKDYKFRYIIADEAQYLKNSNTQNAKSIKKIKADTRYALTGTPIENSLAELWSIFDYIMPGYLFSYKKFKNLYEIPIVKEESEETMAKLKMLIEPFILRRTKKEVLTELPEKTVAVLNNEMLEEQRNIYLSYLAQAKKEIIDEIDLNGFENSQIQILAALTRLRQICCHPSLFIENYEGGSSKLEQCIEIIQDATNSGHKILLFSRIYIDV